MLKRTSVTRAGKQSCLCEWHWEKTDALEQSQLYRKKWRTATPNIMHGDTVWKLKLKVKVAAKPLRMCKMSWQQEQISAPVCMWCEGSLSFSFLLAPNRQYFFLLLSQIIIWPLKGLYRNFARRHNYQEIRSNLSTSCVIDAKISTPSFLRESGIFHNVYTFAVYSKSFSLLSLLKKLRVFSSSYV